MCVSGCPYKKVYFNHRTGKAEKCTFCFPRIEVGLPTVCSETCVGRLRYIGLMLYDADKVLEAASTTDDAGSLRGAARRLPRPVRPRGDPRGRAGRHRPRLGRRRPALADLRADQHLQGRAAAAPGVPHDADGLVHPAAVAGRRRRRATPGRTPRTRATCSPRSTRCGSRSSTSPSCSPPATSRRSTPCCKKLAAMRSYMRDINMGRDPDASIPAAVGMTEEEMYDMYRLLAIAKYDERYVIPPAHAEQAHSLEELATECSLDYDGGPGMGGSGPFGEGSGGADADRGRELPDAARTGRPPTRWPRPADKARAGQPAQLGRQGLAAGPVPARRTRASDAMSRRRRRAPALPAEQLTDRLAVGLAAARLPRRGAARAGSTCCGAASHAAAGAGRRLAPRVRSTTWSRTPLPELQADYVETFDNRRRCNLFLTYFAHGDTRKRGMALLRFKQTYLRAGFELDRRRAARPPVRRARVRRHRRPGPRPRADARPPGRPRAAAPVAARRRLAVGAPCSTRSPPPCRRCAATSATPYAGSPPRARPRRRSGWRRSRRRSSAPAPPPAPRPDRCCPCRRSREPADERVPVRGRPLHLPDDLRRRPPAGATATTSSAGPPGPRSSTRTGCCASAARCSTSASCASSSATSIGLRHPEVVDRRRSGSPRTTYHVVAVVGRRAGRASAPWSGWRS